MLQQTDEELKTLKAHMEETEKKMKADCAEEVRLAREKLDQEEESVRIAVKEQMASDRRDEKLLASAICEMGCFVNKLMVEKRRTAGGKPVDEAHRVIPAGMIESFLAAQIAARAQSNTKKN